MLFIRKLNNLLLVASKAEIFSFDPKANIKSVTMLPKPILPPNLTKGQKEVLSNESRRVVSFEVSSKQDYLAVSLENKQVVVFDSKFTVIKNFTLPRIASKVLFSPMNDLVIADKTGDVYLYLLTGNTQPTILLGHLSMILDMTFSDCGRYVITSDRDEKIRVSHFPNAYNISSFCLGHKEFVTSIKVHSDVLVSGSGDGTVRLWKYKEGELIDILNVNNQVSEKCIIESFSKQMDSEKVDVDALPVTELQISIKNDDLFIAVSLYQYPEILLYVFNYKTQKHSYLRSIKTDIPYCYYFDDDLYVLNRNGFRCYQMIQSDCILLEMTYNEIVADCSNNFDEALFQNDIVMLYKRKYDNVQEYLEKKKARMNTK